MSAPARPMGVLPTVYLDGIGFWAPALAGWDIAQRALRGEPVPDAGAARRPSPVLLPPAERRRAPDTVALALEVAAEAVRASGQDPATLPSVFASAYGDLGLLDALCTTLASQPTMVSPTKFHNSVHNAASGYWTIGTGCHAATTAVSAWQRSFAAGLLDAATQCAADATPVLLVAYDAQAVGALASVAVSEGLLGAALVLSPARGPASRFALDLAVVTPEPAPVALHSAASHGLSRNAMADVLPMCEALARAQAVTFAQALSAGTGLQIALTPLHPPAP